MKNISVFFILLLCWGVETSEAQYTVLLNFDGVQSPQGAHTFGNLIRSGNKLYGMTSYGGSNYEGNIFSVDTDGSDYKDMLDFNYSSRGGYPEGSLLLLGGTLYGMNSIGGPDTGGCMFSIDTDGSNFTVLHNFGTPTGLSPLGSLINVGNILYGMTQYGGLHKDGVIFSINTNGNNYTDIHDFDSIEGQCPHGDLILAGEKLYGVTLGGGAGAVGCIFSIDTNGNNYRDLFDFGGVNGGDPYGSLTLSDGVLYGMGEIGGSNLKGCIFSIDTGGNNYNIVYSFTLLGASGSLLIIGNTIYGMEDAARYGHGVVYGNIFAVNTNGSGFRYLHNFDTLTGYAPHGSLIASGNILYGMTYGGGSNKDGVIFSYKDIEMGIDNLSGASHSIKVYPNPSNGVFTLSWHSEGNEESNSTIEIYNELGQQVYTQSNIQNPTFSINLSSQPNGIYLYRVLNENGSLAGTGKLVIQK